MLKRLYAMKKSEKGAAMIVTLMCVVVLTFLGTALWQYGIGSVNDIDRNFKTKQAYYIAKSGADAMVSYILNHSDTQEIKDYIDKVNGKDSLPTVLGDGSFKIQITRDGKFINVKSTGEYKGTTSIVTASIIERVSNGFPPAIFSNALFSNDRITLNGNVEVNGGIECTGQVRVNGGSNPTYIEHSTKNYPAVIYPSNPSSTNLDIKNSESFTISSDASYNSIHVRNGGTLYFNLPGENITVVINTLDVDGELIISGYGRLYLYVKNFSGGGEVNVNNSLPLSSFMVLMPSGGSYDVSRFKGLLYAPGATVKLNGGPTFTGALVAGNITNSGNPTITYSADAQTIVPSDFDPVDVSAATTIEYVMGFWK